MSKPADGYKRLEVRLREDQYNLLWSLALERTRTTGEAIEVGAIVRGIVDLYTNKELGAKSKTGKKKR